MGAELGMHIVSSNNLALDAAAKATGTELGNFDLVLRSSRDFFTVIV